MIQVKELQEWLNSLNPKDFIAVESGGLGLVHVTTDAPEVGGIAEEAK